MYISKCLVKNPCADFCFKCEFPITAGFYADNQLAAASVSNDEIKIIAMFICVEFTALLTVNNCYKLINLINLYRS